MSKRLRALFLTRKWPPAVGGMETYSVELTTELGKVVDLDIRKLPGKKDGRPPSLAALALFFLTSGVFLLRTRKRYDVVHFGDFVLFPLVWWHSLIASGPVRFVTVHGLDLLYGNRTGFKPAIYRRFIAWARRRDCVDHFVANSNSTAEICKNAGFLPATAVPLGIRLTGDAKPSPAAERYVLFVGRLVRRKGAAWFAKHVLPRLPDDVSFYVVGKIWDEDEGAALRVAPRVKLLGYVPDEALAELKSRASAIVMPNLKSYDLSDTEGFGIVALESAAGGGPLLASNIEGLTDAVRDGETGFLVESGNADAWAERVLGVMAWDAKRRAEFTTNAAEVIRAHYSWQRVAESTLEIYKKCVGTPKTKRESGNVSDIKEIQRYYDEVYYQGTAHRVRVSRHLRKLARSLKLGPGQQILDVACGKGEWLVAARERGAQVAGVDLSPVAIDVCRTNLLDGEFRVGPAEELPFPDNKFDLISCLGSLEHFVEPDKALREMLRVAKPDAQFLILVPNDGFLLRRLGLYRGTRQTIAREVVRSLDEWQRLFTEAGLRVQSRWKDLHVLSLSWINSGSVLSRPVRAFVALLLLVLPVPWQYQVYFFCVRST